MMAEATPESPCMVLPDELMIEILSRVESSNPLQLRCVSKLWKSLVVDPKVMKNHFRRLSTDFKDLLSKAVKDYMDDEKKSFMNAIAQLENLWINLFGEDYEKKHWMLKHIVRVDHLLVVVRYMKENFETIRDVIQTLEDRVKCRQNCMQIYLKSTTSSSS